MKKSIILAIIVLSVATNGWSASISLIFTELIFNTTRTPTPVSAELPIPGTVITSTDPELYLAGAEVGNQRAQNSHDVSSAGFGRIGSDDIIGGKDLGSFEGVGPDGIPYGIAKRGGEELESSGGVGPNSIPYDIALLGTPLAAIPVPEPSTLLFLGAGLFGVACMRRRVKT
jgi:hypothetical protein